MNDWENGMERLSEMCFCNYLQLLVTTLKGLKKHTVKGVKGKSAPAVTYSLPRILLFVLRPISKINRCSSQWATSLTYEDTCSHLGSKNKGIKFNYYFFLGSLLFNGHFHQVAVFLSQANCFTELLICAGFMSRLLQSDCFLVWSESFINMAWNRICSLTLSSCGILLYFLKK